MRDPSEGAKEPYYWWFGRHGGPRLLKARSTWLASNRPERRPAVSAVVPMHRSVRHIADCLTSLRRFLPAGSEIIAVDDASPDGSAEVAKRLLLDSPDHVVVRLPVNLGFGGATNMGARVARSSRLLLFNADAIATAGFLGPMIDELGRGHVAVVGNRHVRPTGKVDSEGSEFSWPDRNYEHVGRNIPDPVPGDGVKDRDVVTFACALVDREAWQALGGLDRAYRQAYFEDADFCLRARSAGWRVVYTPDSTIVHVGNHSTAGRYRKEWRANRRLFNSRWVDTGLVDRFARSRGLPVHDGRVVVCVIACSEEEFIAAAIESVYPLANRIVVVEGGNRFAVDAGLCDSAGRSVDDTVNEVESVDDPRGIVEIVTAPGRPWRDKHEQRNQYVRRLDPGDWMLLLDGDEAFTEQGLWRLSALMHTADVIRPAFHLFWNDLATLGTGRWDCYPQMKAVRWREGWTYNNDHNMPTDRSGTPVVRLPDVKVLKTTERLYHHYSWAGRSDAKLRAKAAYYVGQNGPKVFPADWFDRVFLPWRGLPVLIERQHGTHPYGGGGSADFNGDHPDPVARRVKAGRINEHPIAEEVPA